MSLDPQQKSVYDAETSFMSMLDLRAKGQTMVSTNGSTFVIPSERKFGRVEDVQTYVDRVLALNWVKATWNPSPCKVRPRKGHLRAHWEFPGVIAVPSSKAGRWAMREHVILHELAHHLVGARLVESHGPEFAGTLVALVNEIMGPEAGYLLVSLLLTAGCNVDQTTAHC